MQSLQGKTFLVTGANTGIGRATAIELGKHGATLVLACRTEEKTQPVIDTIRAAGNEHVRFLELDLGDLASVRRAASSFLASDSRLDVLLNNAGLAGQRGLTKDGFELAFGVNHLGHFLLTQLLLDRLKDSAPARIVNVSSRGHFNPKTIDFDSVRQPTATIAALDEYNVSKLCNVLFTQELARRLDGTGVTTYALHPGVIASDVWRQVPWPIRPIMTAFMSSNEDGAKTSLHCATAPELANVSGRYYDNCSEKPASRHCSEKLAGELWQRSEEWTAVADDGEAEQRN